MTWWWKQFWKSDKWPSPQTNRSTKIGSNQHSSPLENGWGWFPGHSDRKREVWTSDLSMDQHNEALCTSDTSYSSGNGALEGSHGTGSSTSCPPLVPVLHIPTSVIVHPYKTHSGYCSSTFNNRINRNAKRTNKTLWGTPPVSWQQALASSSPQSGANNCICDRGAVQCSLTEGGSAVVHVLSLLNKYWDYQILTC